ncbi:MAG: helicase-exonuclease AddAB subunit AddA [Christensenellales bacterium]|jgi:ATP-dependent helicase/nuclease subunit A
MATRNWTDQQRLAIDQRGENLLLSAAAGSGKTAVLVERICRMVLAGEADVDRLLVVTFTRAAAGEMRERVAQALQAAAEGGDRRAQGQLSRLSRASICTLHTFCASLLRRYFHQIGLDPAFRVGQEGEMAVLTAQALSEVIEEAFKDGRADFLSLAGRFSHRQTDGLEKLILSCHNAAMSQPYPEAWLADLPALLDAPGEALWRLPWARSLAARFDRDLAGARSYLDQMERVCNPRLAVYLEAVQADRAVLNALQAAARGGLDSLAGALKAVRFDRLKAARQVDPALKEQAQVLRKSVKALVDRWAELLGDLPAQREMLAATAPQLAALARLCQAFAERFAALKAQRGALDFSDLEHRAIALLDIPSVREQVRAGYQAVFVDEYQDSNAVQEALLERVCRGDNLFMVGDVKQSIYRFRRAEPGLFLDKAARYGAGEGGARIDLNRNFRSRPGLLGAVNDLFDRLMKPELAEMDYGPAERLYPGLDETGPETPVELILLDEGLAAEEPPADEELQLQQTAQREAMAIARALSSRVGAPFVDPATGEKRPLRYGDCAVLLRVVSTTAQDIIQVLSSQGIPADGEVAGGYFDALEIRTMVALLQILCSRRQDVPLLTVLRAPFVGLDHDELVAIRAAAPQGSFYEAMAAAAQAEGPLGDKLRALEAKLDRWSLAARHMPMDSLLWWLYDETGYYLTCGALPKGAQRQGNLRMLVERAEQFRQCAPGGVPQFLEHLSRLRAAGGDLGAAHLMDEDADVVRVMSIHKSKGLQFPLVILPLLGRKFNLRDTRADVLIHPALGLGPTYRDGERRLKADTLPRQAIAMTLTAESLAEELRVLYVALTRAEADLVLVGSARSLAARVKAYRQPDAPFFLAQAQCPLDWIGAVLIRHRDGGPLRALLDDPDSVTAREGTASRWRVTIQAPDTAVRLRRAELGALRRRLERPEAPADWVTERLRWRYPHPGATRIPAKLSVTRLSHELAPVKIPPRLPGPAHLLTSAGPDAAARGTALHTVLRHLDYAAARTPAQVAAQVAELVAREILTAPLAATVPLDKLAAFCNRPAGRALAAAGAALAREMPFNLRMDAAEALGQGEGELLVQGVIDCCFLEDGAWVLYDFKSDRMPEGGEETLRARHTPQLALYARALERITAKPVARRVLCLINLERELEL